MNANRTITASDSPFVHRMHPAVAGACAVPVVATPVPRSGGDPDRMVMMAGLFSALVMPVLLLF